MESTTPQLSTYPHLIPVADIPGTICQAPSHHRRQPAIRKISNHDTQLHRRSESFANLDYQDIIAHYNDTTAKRSRMASDSTTSEDEPDGRKSELRYDFRFGGNFDRRDSSFKPLRGRQDRNSAFTVASARTLCSLSPEPSPPASPSSHHPPSVSGTIAKTEQTTSSYSTLTPFVIEKHHGLYCRIKTFLITFFQTHPDTTAIRFCSHKFHCGQCNKCSIPEAILPYLGGLQAGFHCKNDGCEGCSDWTSTSTRDTYDSDDNMRVTPPRMRSSMVTSLLFTDTQAANTGSKSIISDEAPQIGPIDFISTAQRTLTISDHTSKRSISSTNLSSEIFFESSPTSYDTPEPNTSPTDYSLSVPLYLPTHDRNTPTPCPRPLAAANNEDSALSPQSTESSEILEVNVPAIAVPIVQASPTTIRIRHSRTASQRPATPEEVQSLYEIARNAVHGHMECQVMMMQTYQDISSIEALSASVRYSESEQHLIKKARLVLGLQIQKSARRMPPDLVEKVSAQLFPQDRNEAMYIEAFAAYICQAVVEKELSEARATQILALAEDEGFGKGCM